MGLFFDGVWVTSYFRQRWVNERSENVIKDMCSMFPKLERNVCVAILNGDKKIVATIYGCNVVNDNTKKIDGKTLSGLT